jgi:FkbM family methyltransferase
MNSELAKRRISSFEPLLAAYGKAHVKIHDAIDGGAGFASTAKEMLPYITGSVYAFEPFPGNHRFFEGVDPRIRLIKKALADRDGSVAFRVSATVKPESEWGQRGMVGYSSLGYIVEERRETDLEVQAVRADAELPSSARIGFVKLDLQGGERGALQGMSAFLQDVPLMWVEYIGQSGLVPFLEEQGFLLFDTLYSVLGEPTPKACALFEVVSTGKKLSTGTTRWTAYKKGPWEDFDREFAEYKKSFRLGWTDIVCVHRSRIADFERAVQFL